MSLTGALQIGRSALSASQLGIQITGNNLANAATVGYSRQVGTFIPTRGEMSGGVQVGRGVSVREVRRQVDEALQSRFWGGRAEYAAAEQQSSILSQIEATLGELGDQDLSSELSAFFNVWSERANATRTGAVVVQQGDRLAGFMRRLRGELIDQKRQLDSQLSAGVDRANQLLRSIADLNAAIARAEVSGGLANTLRDQRDQTVTELSSLMDVTVVDQGGQGVDILIGSTPVVLGASARGLRVQRETTGGVSRQVVASVADGQTLGIRSGQLGALLNGRDTSLDRTIGKLDDLAAQLAFEVNKLHSTGRNLTGLTTTSASVQIAASDRGRALNDPNNATIAGLPFAAANGGFFINVRQTGSNTTQTTRINIDLDGLTSAGVPGFGDDTSIEDIRDALDAVDGIRASITGDGRLKIDAEDGYDFSFQDDSSGVLAVLGVNAYFTGTDAAGLAVRSDLSRDPSLLSVGRMNGGSFVENGTALAIAGLQSIPMPALGGETFSGSWRSAVQRVGVESAGASTAVRALSVVQESLESQRAAVSGVSLDEEALNLTNYQRQYQAAARLISVADELTQQLLALV